MSAQERGELPRWPKLTQTLQPPKEWGHCQRCGIQGRLRDATDDIPLLLGWQEHDDQDRPTPAAVVLCVTCTDNLIEAHPRLYSRVQPQAPVPGVMELCRDCTQREGYLCGSPDLTLNGGEGLAITFPEPVYALVRGRGRQTFYTDPPTTCAGRKEAT